MCVSVMELTSCAESKTVLVRKVVLRFKARLRPHFELSLWACHRKDLVKNEKAEAVDIRLPLPNC